MATSVYDNYVEVLETGSVEELQAYARDLSERISVTAREQLSGASEVCRQARRESGPGPRLSSHRVPNVMTHCPRGPTG
jgi:hypothetical protein